MASWPAPDHSAEHSWTGAGRRVRDTVQGRKTEAPGSGSGAGCWGRSPEGRVARGTARPDRDAGGAGASDPRVLAGTTTSGIFWSGWTAGGSSTSSAKTPAAGRRRRLSGARTEGPGGPGTNSRTRGGQPLPRGLLPAPAAPRSEVRALGLLRVERQAACELTRPLTAPHLSTFTWCLLRPRPDTWRRRGGRPRARGRGQDGHLPVAWPPPPSVPASRAGAERALIYVLDCVGCTDRPIFPKSSPPAPPPPSAGGWTHCARPSAGRVGRGCRAPRVAAQLPPVVAEAANKVPPGLF